MALPTAQVAYPTRDVNTLLGAVPALGTGLTEVSGTTTALTEQAIALASGLTETREMVEGIASAYTKDVRIAGESIKDPETDIADITPANLKGDFKGLNVGSSDTTRGIETNDNVIVVETAALATTGGDKDIDPKETGATALLVYVKGASATAGEYKPSTITNEYEPPTEEEYDFGVQVTDNDRFTGFILGSGSTLVGTGKTLAVVYPYAGEANGFNFYGTPSQISAETFTVTAPAFQTVEFPVITEFNSTGFNQLTNATAQVIKGMRYQIVESTPGVMPTVTIGGVIQVIDTNYICNRGHIVPYSFMPTDSGEATFTGAEVCALIWSGKYCERTTNTGYTISSVAIPTEAQSLRAVGDVCDKATPTSVEHRILSGVTNYETLVATGELQRIVTQDVIWYAGDVTSTTISGDWSFIANDFGEVYFTYANTNKIPMEFETVFGVNLVDKLARDVVTISEQELTPAEQTQVKTNLGLQEVGVTINHGTDDTSGYMLTNNNTHIWGTVSSLDISNLDDPTGGTYVVQFDSGATATTFTYPASLKWPDTPAVEANKRYMVCIVRGCATMMGF